MKSAGQIQREYYEKTARGYDAAHLADGDEHDFALGFLVGATTYLKAGTVLDVGAGTGRALAYLKRHAPHLNVHGVEPVQALREQAYAKGIATDELSEGDGGGLAFADGAFDIVCAFGVLHHVKDHARVVGEMLRVARKAVFISDGNNYGQGRPAVRAVKQALHAAKLWPLANLIKTRGKGYAITEGDGLAYSYSVFDDYPLIRKRCARVHLLNTLDAGIDPYRSAGHVAVLGIK
jgi:ubiquinone/menaquinone biosynthesis C-methylase UbiE